MPVDKVCVRCGKEFTKRPRDSYKQYEHRQFCSLSCISRGVIRKSLMARFMDGFKVDEITECWIWIKSTDGHGYGTLASANNGSPKKAHRVSYTLFVGEIPNGNIVRHKCDIPSCVNPDHLEIGTQADNMQDASKRGRLNHVSLLNLHPGEAGFLGAGSKSKKEIESYVSQ